MRRGFVYSIAVLSAFAFITTAEAGTALQPANKSAAAALTGERVSKADLLVVVRNFRDRVGADPNLYYLVNPPGGATEEEVAEVEGEITHFLSRIHKDPSLDFPSKWLRELKEYELTAAEWTAIEQHFQLALNASALPSSLQKSLQDRFRLLRSQVISLS